MQCNLRCPNCNEIHETNSRYCSNCNFDLEQDILRFKNRHLPIHFSGVGVGFGVDGDDFCDCCGDCCCGGSSKKEEKQGCCMNLLDCL